MSERNPLTDPQAGDCILAYAPDPVAIHVVHRRDDLVWFGGARIPIRSATVAAFVETLRMAKATSMNHLSELEKWPVPHA